jgi:hypothetical protein
VERFKGTRVGRAILISLAGLAMVVVVLVKNNFINMAASVLRMWRFR